MAAIIKLGDKELVTIMSSDVLSEKPAIMLKSFVFEHGGNKQAEEKCTFWSSCNAAVKVELKQTLLSFYV